MQMPVNSYFICCIILCFVPSLLWRCWLGSWKSIGPVKTLSDEVLAWLSVWSEVQMTYLWFSWCHCHPIRMLYCTATSLSKVVLEKRPLNECFCCMSISGLSSHILLQRWDKNACCHYFIYYTTLCYVIIFCYNTLQQHAKAMLNNGKSRIRIICDVLSVWQCFSASSPLMMIMMYVCDCVCICVGHTWNIPDSVMSLTLIAAGSSVPDAIASLIVVRDGMMLILLLGFEINNYPRNKQMWCMLMKMR